MTEEYTDDDYIVTVVMVSHRTGFLRVLTYGPYTRGHAQRVRAFYEQTKREGNWDYKYFLTRMRREREAAA